MERRNRGGFAATLPWQVTMTSQRDVTRLAVQIQTTRLSHSDCRCLSISPITGRGVQVRRPASLSRLAIRTRPRSPAVVRDTVLPSCSLSSSSVRSLVPVMSTASSAPSATSGAAFQMPSASVQNRRANDVSLGEQLATVALQYDLNRDPSIRAIFTQLVECAGTDAFMSIYRHAYQVIQSAKFHSSLTSASAALPAGSRSTLVGTSVASSAVAFSPPQPPSVAACPSSSTGAAVTAPPAQAGFRSPLRVVPTNDSAITPIRRSTRIIAASPLHRQPHAPDSIAYAAAAAASTSSAHPHAVACRTMAEPQRRPHVSAENEEQANRSIVSPATTASPYPMSSTQACPPSHAHAKRRASVASTSGDSACEGSWGLASTPFSTDAHEQRTDMSTAPRCSDAAVRAFGGDATSTPVRKRSSSAADVDDAVHDSGHSSAPTGQGDHPLSWLQAFPVLPLTGLDSAKKPVLKRVSMPARPEVSSSTTKPPCSFACLIVLCLESKDDRQRTVSEIYEWVETTFPYFSANSSGWKNSIRHNLSMNTSFMKIPRSSQERRKGCFWTLERGVPSGNVATEVEHFRNTYLPKCTIAQQEQCRYVTAVRAPVMPVGAVAIQDNDLNDSGLDACIEDSLGEADENMRHDAHLLMGFDFGMHHSMMSPGQLPLPFAHDDHPSMTILGAQVPPMDHAHLQPSYAARTGAAAGRAAAADQPGTKRKRRTGAGKSAHPSVTSPDMYVGAAASLHWASHDQVVPSWGAGAHSLHMDEIVDSEATHRRARSAKGSRAGSKPARGPTPVSSIPAATESAAGGGHRGIQHTGSSAAQLNTVVSELCREGQISPDNILASSAELLGSPSVNDFGRFLLSPGTMQHSVRGCTPCKDQNTTVMHKRQTATDGDRETTRE
jgi:hypothetical protein